jgi:hypothetical protein
MDTTDGATTQPYAAAMQTRADSTEDSYKKRVSSDACVHR